MKEHLCGTIPAAAKNMASSSGKLVVRRGCLCVASECEHGSEGCRKSLPPGAHANAKYCSGCIRPMHRYASAQVKVNQKAAMGALARQVEGSVCKGQQESGKLSLLVKKQYVPDLNPDEWHSVAQAVLQHRHLDEDTQLELGFIRVVGGVRELYAPHLPGTTPHPNDAVTQTKLSNADAAEEQYSSFQLVSGYKRLKQNGIPFKWNNTAQALGLAYTRLMDGWMGEDEYYLHATSVLVSGCEASGVPRALSFTTATPVNHSLAYHRKDQFFPGDSELVYADISTGAAQRKWWLARACDRIREWALDFQLFQLISFGGALEEEGLAISNSPLARWIRVRAPTDLPLADGGDGRSADELEKWQQHVVNVVEQVEIEVGIRVSKIATHKTVRGAKQEIADNALRRLGGVHPPYGQIPHIDLSRGEVQLTTALTASCVPTLVYQGEATMPLRELASKVGRSVSQVMGDGWSDYRMLCLPRHILVEGLRRACDEDLESGDVIIMRGGIVHARPY